MTSIIKNLKDQQNKLKKRGFINSDGSDVVQSKMYANLYMSGLKTLYPLVQAVASKQSEVKTEQDLLLQISKMFQAANVLAKHIVNELQSVNVDPYQDENRWALRKIMSTATSSVAHNWMRYGETDPDVIKRLYSSVIMAVTGEITKAEKAQKDDLGLSEKILHSRKEFNVLKDILVHDEPFTETDAGPALIMSLMSGLKPILFEIDRFCWFQEKDQIIDRMSQKVMEGANYLFKHYVDSNENITAQSKQMLLQSCIDKSAGLLAECWRSKSQEDLSRAQTMDKDTRIDWVTETKRNPRPLISIEANHKQMLGYMAAAATKGMNYIKQVMVDDIFSGDTEKKSKPVSEMS